MRHIFTKANFITETTPMYSDPEGNRPYNIRFESLPQSGILSYDGVPVVVGQILDYDVQVGDGTLIYDSDLSILIGHSVDFSFRASDIGSELYSNIGVITINIKKQQIPPTVDDNFGYLTGKSFIFGEESFTKNFTDANGDSYSDVTLKETTRIANLTYQGGTARVGDFFAAIKSNDLQYNLPDRYAIYDGQVYEFEESIILTLVEMEHINYKLLSNENGLMIFGKNGKEYDTLVVEGVLVDSDALCFDFTTKDDSTSKQESNIAEFCIIPQGNINVIAPYTNKPATVGNISKSINHNENINFTVADFTTSTTPSYFDVEGDAPKTLIIDSLPITGSLTIEDVIVTVGLKIPIGDANKITYLSDDSVLNEYSVEFEFRIMDTDSGQFSNIGIVSILIKEKVATPPTVEDSNAPLTENVYIFKTLDFTTQFTDQDNDSYNETKIETLPPIGELRFNDSVISEGYTFPLIDVSNLSYVLPPNIEISPNGYCEFEKPVTTIITEQSSENFELTRKGIGRLEFQKTLTSSVPNNTDIYAFFDATSMKIEDAQAAQGALLSWYQDFKNSNIEFTGNLWILPVVIENWLGFPTAIIRGSLSAVGNNWDRPNDDFMALSIIPPNFDIDSNDINSNWTAPTEVLTLAFIDEVDTGSSIIGTAYHRNRNGYGFDQQPSNQYLTDYKLFKEAHSQFGFFRGILYPIPDIEAGNYNNTGNAMVLQGFAAIEGGARYSLPEIEALGVTFANERRFHWYLDPDNPNYVNRTGLPVGISNPYSAKAISSVPGTNYNLEGLKNYGWLGIYNKDQPASSVFTSSSFSQELDKFLQGNDTSTVETRVILGECYNTANICFDFKTSDDSEFNFFSNTATFCLAPSMNNVPPTVDNNNAPLRIKKYNFNNGSFISNFQDSDGDLPQSVTIKSLPVIGNLKLLGQLVKVEDNFIVANTNNLSFELDDAYAIYGGAVYDFGRSIDIIVEEYLQQGYKLTSNANGKLTFTDVNNSSNNSIVTGVIRTNNNLCFNFTTSDSSILNQESNVAEFCLIPEGNINIKVIIINKIPTVGDNRLSTYYNIPLPLIDADFTKNTKPVYNDPENDAPYQLKVLSLPEYGTLKLGNIIIAKNDILNFGSDITNNKETTLFKYLPDSSRTDIKGVLFRFAVSDVGSKTFVE